VAGAEYPSRMAVDCGSLVLQQFPLLVSGYQPGSSARGAQVAAVKSQHSRENRHGNCMAVNVVSPVYCT